MVIKYLNSGPMAESVKGIFVASQTYERLEALLAETLDTAAEYFRKVHAGELTAADADTALRVGVRLG